MESGAPTPNENLQKMFVEDAPQQVDELENVRSLSNYVINLQQLEGRNNKRRNSFKTKERESR